MPTVRRVCGREITLLPPDEPVCDTAASPGVGIVAITNQMKEFLCLTLTSKPGETEAAFKSRLYAFWTHILRNRPNDYEGVFSEAVEFETDGPVITRRYMIAPEALDAISDEARTHGLATAPVDREDFYSQAEASSSEWFQID
jgi:hypothetical protein